MTTSTPRVYPPLIDRLLRQEGLKALEVYRDGPRYWVGRVRQGEQDLILKAVIHDEPWYSPASGREFRPSDQLRAEILVLKRLQQHAGRLAGGAPEVVASELRPETWVLRTIIPGHDMAMGESSFVYHPNFYQPAVAEALIDYILSYQALTPQLVEIVRTTPHTNQTDLASKMMAADLTRPTELLQPYVTAVKAYLEPRVAAHDAQVDTLSHGEAFPPHVLMRDGRVSMIDWENANLNHRLYDFVSVWVRGFDNPAWQEDFTRRLQQRGLLTTTADQELWNLEVLTQSSRYLNYLYWSGLESNYQKALAIASLRRNLATVLYDKSDNQ